MQSVDIVFLVDTSGSMSDEIDAVKNSCQTFADKIIKEGLNVKLGLVGFDLGGHRGKSEIQNYAVHNLSRYTIGIWGLQSPIDFKNNIKTLTLGLFGGGGCYIANQDTVDIFPFVVKVFNQESNNPKILVIISDEIGDNSGLPQITDLLLKGRVKTYVLGVSISNGAHQAIAKNTGGEFWDITLNKGSQDFSKLLFNVADKIARDLIPLKKTTNNKFKKITYNPLKTKKNMAQLKIGENIQLQSGGSLTVLQELGEGAQGHVYRVKHNSGKEYALKWYKKPDSWMFSNIGNLITKGAPSDDFIWPQMLTNKRDGYFGYVMDLRPTSYKDIIKGKMVVDFNQFSNPDLTRISVAIKICEALKKLHANGLCFHDINDGGFFINPANGKVLICDCDNVTPEGDRSPISGKMRYMAPEIVMGNLLPSKRTDYFSLSVILFLLLYCNHPFEGAKALSYPAFTPAVEKEVYGQNAVFVCDPLNDCNRPVKNIHTNVLKYWDFYPKTLNEAFVKAFSKESILNPMSRMRDTEWINTLCRTRDLLVKCGCGNETFARKDGCHFCKKPLSIPFGLQINGQKIPISSGKSIYSSNTIIGGNIFEEAGQVLVNKKTGQLGIKNNSSTEWAIFDSGRIETIKNGGIVILNKDMKITFSNDITATVI